jgi:hypothetical protein
MQEVIDQKISMHGLIYIVWGGSLFAHQLKLTIPLQMRTSVSRYYRHRFPAEIISNCVWLYFRFALSFRPFKIQEFLHGVAYG